MHILDLGIMVPDRLPLAVVSDFSSSVDFGRLVSLIFSVVNWKPKLRVVGEVFSKAFCFLIAEAYAETHCQAPWR